ncbi:MAG: PASTA domain-containing protein [Cyclobacteriaceae bacterium]
MGEKWKKIVLHLSIILGVFVSLILFFFYAYLPWATNHGQVVVVPDFHGMNEGEVRKITEDLSLNYEILDTVYSKKDEPSTMISQNPKAFFEVKEGRRIYLTLNTATPPMVTFTGEILYKIISKDKTSATIILESLGMKVLKPAYVDAKYKDLVLNVVIGDQRVRSGNEFPKGSEARLIVSNGRL